MAKRKKAKARPTSPARRRPDVRVHSVETEELRLVDRAGRVRAVLEMSRAGPTLAMMHEDGTIALELVLAGDGPAIGLSDSRGKTQLFIGATRGAARIGMADPTGSQRLFIGLNRAGTPTLTLYDRDQQQVWSAAPSPPAPTPSRPRRSPRR